jgi:hypothetical protein
VIVLILPQSANAAHFDGFYEGVVRGADAIIEFTVTNTNVRITEPFDTVVNCTIDHGTGRQSGQCRGTFGGCNVTLTNGRIAVNADGSADADGDWDSPDCYADGTWDAHRDAPPGPGPGPGPAPGAGCPRVVGEATPYNQPDLLIRRSGRNWSGEDRYASPGNRFQFQGVSDPGARKIWWAVMLENDGPACETIRLNVPYWKSRTIDLDAGDETRVFWFFRYYPDRKGTYWNCATAIPTLRSAAFFPALTDKVCARATVG